MYQCVPILCWQIDSKKLQAAPAPLLKSTITQAQVQATQAAAAQQAHAVAAQQAQQVQAQQAAQVQAAAAQQQAYTAATFNAVNGMRAAYGAQSVPQPATSLTNYAVAAG